MDKSRKLLAAVCVFFLLLLVFFHARKSIAAAEDDDLRVILREGTPPPESISGKQAEFITLKRGKALEEKLLQLENKMTAFRSKQVAKRSKHSEPAATAPPKKPVSVQGGEPRTTPTTHSAQTATSLIQTTAYSTQAPTEPGTTTSIQTTAYSTQAPTEPGTTGIKETIQLQRAHTPPEKNLFTFFQSSNAANGIQLLNPMLWAKLLPGWRVVVLNDSTVADWIPDLPAEFLRLYGAAKSDVVRVGALYHHGGLYFDTDILVVNGTLMSAWANKLFEGYEIVSYGDSRPTNSVACEFARHHAWSSNCMGASKQNPFMETWWKNVKAKFSRTCTPQQFKSKIICCYISGMDVPQNCHIPWGHIEHLKALDSGKDGTAFPFPHTAGYNSTKLTYCLNGPAQTFIAPENSQTFLEIYSPAPADGACHPVPGTAHLSCPHLDSAKLVENYFSRAAYHLFSSSMPAGVAVKKINPVELLNTTIVLSELIKRSMGFASTTPLDKQMNAIMAP
jgi:hypothetical protein